MLGIMICLFLGNNIDFCKFLRYLILIFITLLIIKHGFTLKIKPFEEYQTVQT